MPTYEYRCPKCGVFEIFQHMSDDPLPACPTCGRPVKKLVSRTTVIFNGTGFYTTDYARSSGDGTHEKQKAPKEEKQKAPKEEKKKDTTKAEKPA